MVGLFKQQYGRGPTAAKALISEEYVCVVLENGLTRNEETLIANGHSDEVRRFRLAFESAIREDAMRVVADATGQRVVNYHSQIIFDPVRSFELFVLEPRPSAQ